MTHCKSCRFFSMSQVMGLCRRYPKAENKHEMDWCGEHELAQAVSVPVIEPETLVQRKKPGRPPKNDPSAS